MILQRIGFKWRFHRLILLSLAATSAASLARASAHRSRATAAEVAVSSCSHIWARASAVASLQSTAPIRASGPQFAGLLLLEQIQRVHLWRRVLGGLVGGRRFLAGQKIANAFDCVPGFSADIDAQLFG